MTTQLSMLTEAAAPAAALRVLAVGTLSADVVEIRAASLLCPRRHLIEHRVARWPGRGWVAEVRVNGAMSHHSTFAGDDGYAQALSWCQAVAPLAQGKVSP